MCDAGGQSVPPWSGAKSKDFRRGRLGLVWYRLRARFCCGLEGSHGKIGRIIVLLARGRDLGVLVGVQVRLARNLLGGTMWSALEDRRRPAGLGMSCPGPMTRGASVGSRIQRPIESGALMRRLELISRCAGVHSPAGEESPRPGLFCPPTSSHLRASPNTARVGAPTTTRRRCPPPHVSTPTMCSVVHSINNGRGNGTTDTHTEGLVGRPGGTTNWPAAERSKRGGDGGLAAAEAHTHAATALSGGPHPGAPPVRLVQQGQEPM